MVIKVIISTSWYGMYLYGMRLFSSCIIGTVWMDSMESPF